MKICSNCKVEKHKTEFHRNKSRKDGVNVYCKSCVNQKIVNKEARDIYNANYRAENKKSISLQKAEYYRKHKEEKAKYYQENKQSIAAKRHSKEQAERLEL